MKLYYWPGINGHHNFGDELNKVIWPRLMPEVFTEETDQLFVGIGTLINQGLPYSPLKVILGAGVGYGPCPEINNSLKIYCVRGPLSAQTLKLEDNLAIIDPGVLIAKLIDAPDPKRAWKFGYMPHWRNAGSIWEEVCGALDWAYIDPRWEVSKVLSVLSQVGCLVTEAMHGAIVAESLRIPWVPTIDIKNRDTLPFKWRDWCSSIHVAYEPIKMHNLQECFVQSGDNVATSEYTNGKEIVCDMLERISGTAIPILSHDSILSMRISQLEEKIFTFKEDFKMGQFK
jgi:succinoglycan biosynthesis protein ExoV